MAFEIEEPTLWEEAGATSAQIQAEQLQRVPGGPRGYRLRRLILVNFWLYDVQEFEIPHGRLFLAGENASGKSTVLMAAIPMVLDGNFSAARIDTFGKREKRIDYYILGSNESATPFLRDQRTSYVALEFEWCEMETPPFASELRARWERGEYAQARYLTLGLAFNGNRNSANPVSATRFVITDGTRLVTHNRGQEHTLPIVQRVSGGNRALDMRTFRKLVAEHGGIYETIRDYEQKVAQVLFNFSNVQDFRRLIQQLLYLRQPNLNSVLSLEAVRAYLDQSLPQIPGDMIQHAGTTLEMMDSLREEIERRKKAYTATEKLHHAQEALTLARVRLAACEYLHEQFQEDREQSNVRRLKSNLTRYSNEFERSRVQLNALEEEEARIAGELRALQGSEGLQAAQRLSEVAQQAANLENELRNQQELLEDMLHNREQAYENTERYRKDFAQFHQDSMQHLNTIGEFAEKQALWEIAADQIGQARQALQQFGLDAATPDVNVQISSLLDSQIEERLTWLHRLGQLHRKIEQDQQNMQSAQQRETRYYNEFDEATRDFEELREQSKAAHHSLDDILSAIVEESDELADEQFSGLRERGVETGHASLTPQEFVEQFRALVQEYAETINIASSQLHRSARSLQSVLGELQGRAGGKSKEVQQAEDAYQTKLREPEYSPPRTPQRQEARAQLAQRNIPALPLYTLIDFEATIDSASGMAGRIEQILGDAGLLDALVVPSAYINEADHFLKQAGLSDCRLNIERLLALEPTYTQPLSEGVPLLRVDSALYQELGEQAEMWAATVTTILSAMQRTVLATRPEQTGSWKHGLLVGQSGEATARCIGTATRVREQQRAQEELRMRWQTLRDELTALRAQIEQTTSQLRTLTEHEEWLNSALKTSEIEKRSQALQQSLLTWEKAQKRYHEARAETQELRQRISTARVQLQKESGQYTLFINSLTSVEQAQEATNKLRSQYQSLRNDIGRLLRAWRDYKQSSEALERAKSTALRANEAYARKEREAASTRAELETLTKLVHEVEGEDVATLFERLQRLQDRASELPEEKQKEHDALVRLDENMKGSQSDLETAQETLERAQLRRSEVFEAFATLLKSYPIELLLIAQKDLEHRSAQDVTQSLLSTPLSNDEAVYHSTRGTLTELQQSAYDELYATYSEVSNLLHDYGPRLVAGGNIVFVNAEQANPFELLTRLGEEIRQQEQLLDDKERELFRDFLLKEMADTIRKYILEAEDWIERINGVLASTAIIEEHYHLDWVTKEYEHDQPGSYLAQHHKLLRRQAQTLKQEEVDTLVHAFRQEVASVRASLQENSGISFVEALAHIFDYRQWFRFEIIVILADRSRLHLTDRLLKKRSGAEQYVALYVPFFAALSALYESAGEGAPRLVALDEAFDKVSVKNTHLMMKFLASQHFQWIMTGPRLTGEGTDLPASVRYLMLHQKGTELATGFASFWSNTQLKINQGETDEQV